MYVFFFFFHWVCPSLTRSLSVSVSYSHREFETSLDSLRLPHRYQTRPTDSQATNSQATGRRTLTPALPTPLSSTTDLPSLRISSRGLAPATAALPGQVLSRYPRVRESDCLSLRLHPGL
ncbi:hypothetical protein RchiOBHm_Chr7g0181941 [Rosa chinensis]|uniref:Secreted protein n=1 Tax=Rosa chinensis TaxID=74649 RepID=A0A2P6P2R6_ROSCH|nr:hypothetical protein RchiOBHm_Chr7g0181941 [Rosa chinensis]